MNDASAVEWDLPTDVLVDILRRLPPTSAAKCACVTKSWRDVTSMEPSLKRKIGLERAWLHDPIDPVVKEYGELPTFCYAKVENLIALGGAYKFTVLDFEKGEIVFDCDETGSVQSVSFMDGMLLSGGCDGDLCGWDVSTWDQVFCVSIFDCYIFAIADLGNSVAVGSFDGDLQIWRKGVWELERALEGHKDNVYSLHVEQGRLLISGSLDETIRIWDLTTHACVRVIEGQNEGVSSLGICGGVILCGANDGNVRSWKLESGQHVRTFRGHTNSVTSLVVKGGRFFTSSHDGTVKIWDVSKGECVRSFDCSHEEEGGGLEVVEVIWVDDEKLIVFNGVGELWEWDFSRGFCTAATG